MAEPITDDSGCVWYLPGEGGRTLGPYTAQRVLDQLRAGQLSGTTPCWRDGMDSWQPLEQVQPFITYLPQAPAGAEQGDAATEVISLEDVPPAPAGPAGQAADARPASPPGKPPDLPSMGSRSLRRRILWIVLGLAVPIGGGAALGMFLILPLAGSGAPEKATRPAELGKIVLHALKTGNEEQFLSTLLEPDAYSAWRQARAERGSGPDRPRPEVIQQEIEQFAKQYPENRQKYLQAFQAASRRARELRFKWDQAKLLRVECGLLREDPSGREADSITVHFRAGRSNCWFRLVDCQDTPDGWRTRQPQIFGPNWATRRGRR